MQLCRRLTIAAGMVLAVVMGPSRLAAENTTAVETRNVAKTYNNAPFEYKSSLLSDRAEFRVYRLTYPSPVVTPVEQNNTIPADYYLPKNLLPGLKYPAVICLHILNGDEQLTDLVCSVLANRGIPALSFKLPYYGERGLPQGPEAMADDPQLFLGAIVQAGEDIRRTVDLLASREEINPERIGITGISLGGITAATAAEAEPRLYRASLMLAGGDLPQIIGHARETRPLKQMIEKLPPAERAEVETRIGEVDPLRSAAALRDRAREGRVLMINAGNDEVVPRKCTEKLAEALGIADRVVWFEGLGHYTAMAELPRAMRMTADFFAQDLPPEARTTGPAPADAKPTPLKQLAAVLQQIIAMVSAEPEPNRCHVADLEISVSCKDGKKIETRFYMARDARGRFAIKCNAPFIGEIFAGQNEHPWMVAGGKKLLVGTKNPVPNRSVMNFVDSRHTERLYMGAGVAGGVVLAPDILQQWIAVDRNLRIVAKDSVQFPGEIQLALADDGQTPAAVTFDVAGTKGELRIRAWQINTVAPDALFDPPEGLEVQEVEEADLHHMFGAVVNFAVERLDEGRNLGDDGKPPAIKPLARDPAGHGLLCHAQNKLILMVSGTPEQMGAAQGVLLQKLIPHTFDRTVYLIGAVDTIRSGKWFFDTLDEIERRTGPFVPPRFFAECDALAQASGLSKRDARYANLFPERFHCSGAAVRGKASVGGRVLHLRILDYMRDIDLQDYAMLTVFLPEGRNAWMSQSYAGFVGTVTCMNEKGLAIGQMGASGEGDWDGMPMTFLLRDVMERASTVAEAAEIIRNTPRTCHYYYVLSDRSGDILAMGCTPEKVEILKPGQQHPLLPPVPDDTVFISAGERLKALGQKLQENHGAIDVPKMIEIIKRPVAMDSNLHDAIFAPETLEIWFADAGKHTPACDEPYAHLNLRELIEFYKKQNSASK